MNYTGNYSAQQLLEAASKDPNVKEVIWNKYLEAAAQTADDFSMFEGAPRSNKPFWAQTDLTKSGGDTVVFTVTGDAAGPLAVGEAQLEGNESEINLKTFSCRVELKRDAVALTEKHIKMIAVKSSIEQVTLGMLAKKMGRARMYEMMMALILQANGNIIRPNRKKSRDDIRASDTLSLNFLVTAKALAQGKGARPVGLTKSKSGSIVNQLLAFICQDALADIRNSSSYQTAVLEGSNRGETNETFSGKLVDWQGMFLFEHIVVDGDTDDFIGSPLNPKAILGEAVTAGTAAFDVRGYASTTRGKNRNLFFQFFKGYDWIFNEDQTPATDSNTYYFWIVNPEDAQTAPGLAGFYSYTGSDNDGNKITIKERLAAAASGDAKTKVGEVTWNAALHTDEHPIGSYIIPANKWGVPIAYSFLLGAGAAVRAYGFVKTKEIKQERDYGMVRGQGYKSVFGQSVYKDTSGKPRHYMLLEHAVEHPGINVPYVPENP